jgi:hypothetical protein
MLTIPQRKSVFLFSFLFVLLAALQQERDKTASLKMRIDHMKKAEKTNGRPEERIKKRIEKQIPAEEWLAWEGTKLEGMALAENKTEPIAPIVPEGEVIESVAPAAPNEGILKSAAPEEEEDPPKKNVCKSL